MRRRTLVALALLTLAFMVGAGVAHAADPIKIGALLPLTGSGASYGAWMKGCSEIAAEEINAAGGIAGHKLEVIFEDHAADASKGVSAMRRLVDVEKAPFVLTSYSSVSLAIQPIGVQNKVVMMNGGGQSDNLANKDYLYNNIPVVSNEVAVIVDWLTKEKGFKRAVLITANDEAGRNGAKTFRERFGAAGGRVLAEEQIALEGTDFRAQLAKLRAAGGDLLYINSYGRNVSIVCDQARELGIKIPIAGTSWTLVTETFKARGAEGMLVTRLPFDASSAFAKKFKERYNADTGFFGPQYYNATKIFARAAEEAAKKNGGRIDGDGIKNAIESIKSFETISGLLVFQANHAALMDIEAGTIKNGKVEVEKVIKAVGK